MHFLVVDGRFGCPIYVFLEIDPRGAEAFPGFAVREVAIELWPSDQRGGRAAIGRDPRRLDRFREFRSDAAAAAAGFTLIEPQYVGPTWEAYAREFRPQGEKPHKRAGGTRPVGRAAGPPGGG